MFIKLYPDNPNPRHIDQVVEVLKNGGVIIYPSDTVYAFGCDITKPKAIEKIAMLKGIKKDKANFSFVCADLSHLSEYTKPISNDLFKFMKAKLPGAYTFILPASSKVPKLMQSKKKTVGIRVPDNNIPLEIVKALGNPILTTSIHDDDEIIEYMTDPELINEKYDAVVDMVIDGGYGDNVPSTIIDCTGDEYVITREGKGEI
jgi:tRNA threonylcarbamoyl adenosine modification protein (Sua5/YciO/YrdC/YwlC family)